MLHLLAISLLATHFLIQVISREYITPALIPVMMQFAFKSPMEGLTESTFTVNVHSL